MLMNIKGIVYRMAPHRSDAHDNKRLVSRMVSKNPMLVEIHDLGSRMVHSTADAGGIYCIASPSTRLLNSVSPIVMDPTYRFGHLPL